MLLTASYNQIPRAQKMGTIVPRTKTDGSMSYSAQILRKKDGKILHREAKTFDREKDAIVWMRRRESELDSPEGLERAQAPDPKFKLVIDTFLGDTKRIYGKTQQHLYAAIRDESDIADMDCSEIRAQHIVAYGKKLFEGGRSKSTVAGYISALGSILTIAKPAWGFRVDASQYEEAVLVLRKLEMIGASLQRDRRPSLAELDKLMTYFVDRSIKKHNHGVAPMHRVVAFAMFSTRRLDEIIRQKRSDLNFENKEMMVREMKDPRNKRTNDVRCEMPPEAVEIAKAIRIDQNEPDRLFPYNYGQVQQAFSKAVEDLDIIDLTFHDLRHEGISRLFEMGRTIPQAASVSGHRNWKSLQRYTHLRQTGDKFENWKWMPTVTAPQFFQIQP